MSVSLTLSFTNNLSPPVRPKKYADNRAMITHIKQDNTEYNTPSGIRN
jgi:hypothetical protein